MHSRDQGGRRLGGRVCSVAPTVRPGSPGGPGSPCRKRTVRRENAGAAAWCTPTEGQPRVGTRQRPAYLGSRVSSRPPRARFSRGARVSLWKSGQAALAMPRVGPCSLKQPCSLPGHYHPLGNTQALPLGRAEGSAEWRGAWMMTQTVHPITAALTPTVHLPLSFMSHSTTFHIPTCPPILPPAAHLPMYPLLTSLSAWPHCLLHSALPLHSYPTPLSVFTVLSHFCHLSAIYVGTPSTFLPQDLCTCCLCYRDVFFGSSPRCQVKCHSLRGLS